MKKARNKYLSQLCASFGEAEHATAVRKLVCRFRVPGEPLESVVRKLGIAEIRKEPLPFDGGIFVEDQRSVIKLNSLRDPMRSHFTLAHEAGHLMLATTVAKPFKQNCSDDISLERACDAIAGELVMPFEETVEFASGLGRQSPEKLGIIAKKFQVSLHAAALRLHNDLKLWKLPVGLWQCEKGVRELWFVGNRPWGSPNQFFSAFEMALESREPIVVRERYSAGACTELVDLKIFHIGNQKVLGVVAT